MATTDQNYTDEHLDSLLIDVAYEVPGHAFDIEDGEIVVFSGHEDMIEKITECLDGSRQVTGYTVDKGINWAAARIYCEVEEGE